MMIGRELAANAKQEGNVNNTAGDDQKISKLASSSNNSITTSSWSRLKDPRIVRVSRAFGGKDRHSKVCTVRGLRDRRVRLSVPTAIQLYDLQDRLGLNQPSKVVDWLLDAAKHEIDELPPLQMPPNSGNLIISSHNLQPSGSTWNSSDHIISRPKSKQVSRRSDDDHQEGSKQGHDFDQDDDNHHNGTYNVSSSNNFLISNNSAHQASYTSLLRWDPSTLSLAQSGLGAAPTEDHNFHNFNVVSVASAAAAAPQVLVYQPPVGITQSYFPSTAEYHDHVPKHINFQMLNNSNNSLTDSTSQQQSIRPFHMANFLSTTTQKDRAGGNELSSNNEGDFGSSR